MLGLDGVPPSGLDGGTPHWDWMGVPPIGGGWGVPPSPRNERQLNKLCCGRYVSYGFPQEDFLVVVDDNDDDFVLTCHILVSGRLYKYFIVPAGKSPTFGMAR